MTAQFYLHDLGVVVLDGKGYQTPDGSYAQLPGEDDAGLLDGLAVGTIFTTVGYGRQSSYPADTPADEMLTDAARVRMIAHPTLDAVRLGPVRRGLRTACVE